MALKALMLRKKIDAKKAKLEDLRAKAAEFQTREAELEEALGEITEESTDEERATVEAEVEALTADQEANDGAITDLEGEIAEMEGQLATEEEAQRNKAKEQQKRSVDQGRKEAREVDTMPTRIVTRFADMNIMERHKFFEDEKVRSFLGAIRAMANRRDAGSVSNAQVLIPEIMLPMLFQIVEENSKMMKHFYGPNVPGTGRVRIDGVFEKEIPDGVVAPSFNIYEDGRRRWSVEVVGTSSFDKDGEDWACDEATDFETRDAPYSWEEKTNWKNVAAAVAEAVQKIS